MSKNNSATRERIIIQVTLLIAAFIISFSGLNISHKMLEKRQVFLDSLVKNENNKIEISHLIQKSLLEIQSDMQYMSHVVSANELGVVRKRINNNAKLINDYLKVINTGGTINAEYKININNSYTIKKEINYINYYKDSINLEIIELRSKMAELSEIISKLDKLVSVKVNGNKTTNDNSTETPKNVDAEIYQFLKNIFPFYVRLMENSNRLHYDSLNELKKIVDHNEQFKAVYEKIIFISTLSVLVFILTLGVFALMKIKRIINERQKYQDDLKKLNDNLEEQVVQRTSELGKEIVVRRKAEEELRKQASFLTNVIESLGHPFYVIDVQDFSIKIANSASYNFGGINTKTCYALTHKRTEPCSGAEHPCPLQIIKETKEPVILEHIHYDKNGTLFYVEVHGYPIFDEKGELVQMIEYSLDVTEKKKAQEELLKSMDLLEEKVKERTFELESEIIERKKIQRALADRERHFRMLIENISDIITIVDNKGIIKYTSPSVTNVLGYNPKELIGTNIYNIIHNEDVHVSSESFEAFLSQLKSHSLLEHRIKSKSGDFYIMESKVNNLLAEPGIAGFVLNSRDITKRVKTELENRKLSMVIEQNPSSVVITDIEGNIEYVNPFFEIITGYTLEEVKGENPRILNSGLNSPDIFIDMWNSLKNGKTWRGELINKKKNGDVYEESVTISPIKDTEGNTTHYVALKENVTEIKKAKLEAEKANRAKSEFLSKMSHELRTPLNAINGFSSILLKSKKHPLNEKQTENVMQILNAGNHLLNLINDILDLAKIEAGKMSIRFDKVSVRGLMDECIALISSAAKNSNIELKNEFAENADYYVSADKLRLKQILLNLVSNAVKYNVKEGKVTLNVMSVQDKFVRITVKDTGHGIPLDKQDQIFQPFNRLASEATGIEGTGIGLTISKQLVEMMSGTMGFYSDGINGSEFWIELPVILNNELEQTDSSTQPVLNDDREEEFYPAEDVKMLYIEDNEINTILLSELANYFGYFNLHTAKDGLSGIASAMLLRPEIILLDLGLPDMNGFDVFRKLKSMEEFVSTPIVAVTADAMEESKAEALRLGFTDYLTKPINIDAFSKVISSILRCKHEIDNR